MAVIPSGGVSVTGSKFDSVHIKLICNYSHVVAVDVGYMHLECQPTVLCPCMHVGIPSNATSAELLSICLYIETRHNCKWLGRVPL